MFVFIKKIFVLGPLNAIPLSSISMKNQDCKVRSQIINVNSNNPIF